MEKAVRTALIIDVLADRHPLIEAGLYAVGVDEIRKISFRDLSGNKAKESGDLVIVNCEFLNGEQLGGLLVYAKNNKRSQFLVLAQQISIHAYRRVAEMSNVITLQMPCDPTIYEGLLKEMIKGMDLANTQRFPRFVTDEPARMMVMETGLLIPTRMRNYSVGGAFLEYRGISLRVGHSLDINLLRQEDPPSKNRLRMSAKVIWIRNGETRLSSSRGVGVQFFDFSADQKDL